MALRFKGNIKPSGAMRANAGPPPVPWWDENALFAIDGTGGIDGSSVFENLAGEGTPTNNGDVTFSSESVEAGNTTSLKFVNTSSMALTRTPAVGSLNYENPFTVEATIRRTGTSGTDNELITLYHVKQTSSNLLYFGFYNTGSTYDFYVSNNTANPNHQTIPTNISTTSANNLPTTHLAVVYDNTDWFVYVNGQLQGTILQYGISGALSTSEYFGVNGTGHPTTAGNILYVDKYQMISGKKYDGNFTPDL